MAVFVGQVGFGGGDVECDSEAGAILDVDEAVFHDGLAARGSAIWSDLR
jgi:hypothetical protein